MKVLGIGDNVCDVYLHSGMMYPGGQALNIAVYSRALGCESSYIGVFGDDEVAAHIKAVLDNRGISYAHSRTVGGDNGYACVNLVDGDRVFVASNKGGVLQQHPIVLDGEDLAYAEGFNWIHTSNNGYMDDQLPKLAALGNILSYDFSYRWTERDRIDRVIPHADIAFFSGGDISKDEAAAACADMLHSRCAMVVATLGSRGSLLMRRDDTLFQKPNLVQARDTLGAGDSFAAGMVCSLMQCGATKSNLAELDTSVLQAAMQAGAEYAAQTCLQMGAFGEGTPAPEALLALHR